MQLTSVVATLLQCNSVHMALYQILEIEYVHLASTDFSLTSQFIPCFSQRSRVSCPHHDTIGLLVNADSLHHCDFTSGPFGPFRISLRTTNTYACGRPSKFRALQRGLLECPTGHPALEFCQKHNSLVSERRDRSPLIRPNALSTPRS